MYSIFIFCFLLVKEIKGESEEYYECLFPYESPISPSNCLSIDIPDSDKYKCCSLKISYQNKTSYNCFPLENNYTKNKEALEEYMNKKSISSYFSTLGGQIEIECGDEIKYIKEYEKFSDEFNACYSGHINGANDEYTCIENNISNYERKCCFIESSKKDNNTIIEDKRCYMIKEEYFKEEKNLNNYLLDELNINNLEEIKDRNYTIKCKNYETFYFISKNYEKKEKETKNEEEGGLSGTFIAFIIILIILVLLVAVFYLYRWKRRQSISANINSLISIGIN